MISKTPVANGDTRNNMLTGFQTGRSRGLLHAPAYSQFHRSALEIDQETAIIFPSGFEIVADDIASSLDPVTGARIMSGVSRQ